MRELKILRDCGYVEDLTFPFYCHYNKEIIERRSILFNEETREIYEALMNRFKPISDDLYVFFHAIKNERSFFCKYFHHIKSHHFTTDYSFEYVLSLVSNRTYVIKNLIEFYFYDLPHEEIEKCVNDPVAIMKVIKASEYTPLDKSKLYEFFMDPDGAIETLKNELIEMESRLSVYYEEHYEDAVESFLATRGEALEEILREHDVKEDDELYAFVCLLNRGLICGFAHDDNRHILGLGIDYAKGWEALKNQKPVATAEDLGTALGDKSRVKMLDMLLERGEMTCKELELHFHFSASTAYHHLTTMMRCGVLKSRFCGKLVYYSVNRPYFTEAIKMLGKYAEKE